MAQRLYFNSQTPEVTPDFHSDWEQTGDASRGILTFTERQASLNVSMTIPITVIQDILGRQFVSDPIPAQDISGTVACVVNQCNENNASDNARISINIYVISNDGSTVRGVLYSAYGADMEFSSVTASTRIINTASLTTQTAQQGDRIVVELGVSVDAPTSASSCSFVLNRNSSLDSPLQSNVTILQNSWIEFSQNIFPKENIGNDFRKISVGNGMGRSESAT